MGAGKPRQCAPGGGAPWIPGGRAGRIEEQDLSLGRHAYRATRTLPPRTARSTSASVTWEVLPGVIIARAPNGREFRLDLTLKDDELVGTVARGEQRADVRLKRRKECPCQPARAWRLTLRGGPKPLRL